MKGKLLIVDDNSANLQVLGGVVAADNFEVEFANSGEEALIWISECDFDLILLDVNMPGLNGWQICQRIKLSKKSQDIPIIFLTADVSPESINYGFLIGAVDYITKPFDQRELLCRINTHVELRQSKRALSLFNERLEHTVSERTLELQNSNQKLRVLEKENHEQFLFFREIFEKSPIGMVLIDEENVLVETNAAFTKLFKNKREIVNARYLTDFFETKDKRLLDKMISEKQNIQVQFKLNGNTNDFLWANVSVSAFFKNSRKVTAIVTIEDVSEQIHSQNKVLSAILETESKERARFASDLHDGIGPILSTAKLYVNSFENRLDKKEMDFLINKTKHVLDEAIQNVKLVSKSLSPYVLRDFGLQTAIDEFNTNVTLVSKTQIEFNSNLEIRLNANVEMNLYRIYTELVTNTLKHGRAKNIHLKLNYTDSKLIFNYTDDGAGFNIDQKLKDANGLGLSNIMSRVKSLNGLIEMQSEPMFGMEVNIKFNNI